METLFDYEVKDGVRSTPTFSKSAEASRSSSPRKDHVAKQVRHRRAREGGAQRAQADQSAARKPRQFDAIDYCPGLDEAKRQRTNADFRKLICMNITWIAYQAHRTGDQSYVDQYIQNFRQFALQNAHNA